MASFRLVACIALLACALAASSFAQEPAGVAASDPAQSGRRPLPPLPAGETVSIPMPGAGTFGGEVAMHTQVFRPPGEGPFPVVVFSHGRAGEAADRARLKSGISNAQLRFWLARGDAVVAPIRPGYGATGGSDRESSGARFDQFGHCGSVPDYRHAAQVAADTVDATLSWLRAQPWADVHHVLLVGQSVGGMTTVAAGARAEPGVVGLINFAGGAGGSPDRAPGHSCDPDQLIALYGEFGRATKLPSLWVYAINDQYWGADVPAAWHAAFAAGGSRTTFVHAPAVADGDGHGLSHHDPRLWAPAVDTFLATIDFPATHP